MEVEVGLKSNCIFTTQEIHDVLMNIFRTNPESFLQKPLLPESLSFPNHLYSESIRYITVNKKTETQSTSNDIQIFCYIASEDPISEDCIEAEGETTAIAVQTTLPNIIFEGLWDSIIFDDEDNDIKSSLLSYMNVAITFSDHAIDPNTVNCNRIILLHGPPGTGKTTICHGLAQKLSIRFSSRYPSSILLEVNTHSIFSKWFAESGKMVKKLFDRMNEIASDNGTLLFVLIDEVESIATARNSSAGGSDPSDAIRVVNALLTQIDQLRRKTNVVIMATSNLTDCIDMAFLSRADVKQYVGPPGVKARYAIFYDCLNELMRKGIVSPQYDLIEVGEVGRLLVNEMDNNDTFLSTRKLIQAAKEAEGLSGRTLRKLPFLSFVYKRIPTVAVSLNEYLDALINAIKHEKIALSTS